MFSATYSLEAGVMIVLQFVGADEFSEVEEHPLVSRQILSLLLVKVGEVNAVFAVVLLILALEESDHTFDWGAVLIIVVLFLLLLFVGVFLLRNWLQHSIKCDLELIA